MGNIPAGAAHDQTPASLLERLRQPGPAADWERFVQLYTPLLRHWASRLGARAQESDDLVQDVFTVLVRKLPEFHYDPGQRFRGWLWTVTANTWRKTCPRKAAVADGDLAAVAGPADAEGIDEAEYRQYLVRRALDLMRADFEPTTWKAFWENVTAGRPAADVAAELGISENAVYLAKGRVLRRLRQELAGLLD